MLSWQSNHLRGEGGGSSLKKWKFFVLSYVVALSLNSKWLLRYDATKLTRLGAFSRICMGNRVKLVKLLANMAAEKMLEKLRGENVRLRNENEVLKY